MTVSRLRPADKVSDIDLANWQKYPDILTDSLWILDSRDSSDAHRADYHDIIRFSDNPADLSNCQDTDIFLERFLSVYSNLSSFLEVGRYLAVVIGDIYANSEWIPLQNLITSQLLSKGELRLKSIIIKNIINNRAKRNQENLWRYRALANGFYIFKHEYIVLFQKTITTLN